MNKTIDFYILEGASLPKAWHFACQLIEKLYGSKQSVYVNTRTQEEAERFDALLWTYRDDSFLPHALYRANETDHVPIQIGHGTELHYQPHVVLNLYANVLAFFQQAAHLIEIVYADPLVQQAARERYRIYKNENHLINTHKLKANEI